MTAKVQQQKKQRTRDAEPPDNDKNNDQPKTLAPWIRYAIPVGGVLLGLMVLGQLIGAIGYLLDPRDRDLAPPIPAATAPTPATTEQTETQTQVAAPTTDMLEAQKRLWDEVQGKYLAVSREAGLIDEQIRLSRVAAWQQFCNDKANREPGRYASGYDCLYQHLIAQLSVLNQFATYLQAPSPQQAAQLNDQLQAGQVDQIRVYAIKTNTRDIEGYRAQMQVFLDIAAALSSKPGEALPTAEISTQALGESVSGYVSATTAFNKISPEIVRQIINPQEVASETSQP
jgi:hypothetical protein